MQTVSVVFVNFMEQKLGECNNHHRHIENIHSSRADLFNNVSFFFCITF